MNFLKRIIFKLIFGPIKYGRKNYNAERYWGNRFANYGLSIRGAGNESRSENMNQIIYARRELILDELLHNLNFKYGESSILDIGCGSGYYTKFFNMRSVKEYTGFDITNKLFDALKDQYPDYNFYKVDITNSDISGQYGLVIMIDVIEHITDKTKLENAMANVSKLVKEGGIVIISPIKRNARSFIKLFYQHHWTLIDIMPSFKGWKFENLIDFEENGKLLVMRKENNGRTTESSQ